MSPRYYKPIEESVGEGIRLGLAVRGYKDRRQEQDKLREKEEARSVKLGERQEKEFEWKEEDREKKKDYEVVSREFGVVKALHEAGKDREAAAKLSNIYNKKWPDGNESRVVFRSDTTNPQLQAKWDADPNLAGKEIGVLSKTGGILPFKTMKELMKYSAASLNQTEYLKGYKTAETNIAQMNAQEKPFRAKDGYSYVQTWEIDSGGTPKKGPIVPYKEKTAATKAQQTGLDIKEYENILGRPLSSKEKMVKLGLSAKESGKGKTVDAGKLRDRYKKDLNLVLKLFSEKPKSIMFDDEGNLTESGQNSLDSALKLIEKAENNPEKLTSGEKKKLPHAKRAWDMFSKISEAVSAEYEPESDRSWKQYRATTGTATPSPRTKLPIDKTKQYVKSKQLYRGGRSSPIPPSYQ